MKKIKKILDDWQKILKKIGFWQSRILLGIIYFLCIFPVAILFQMVGDPLNLKKGVRWTTRGESEIKFKNLKEQ